MSTLAVGEIDQPQNGEDHRQPDRDQRVDAAQAERVDELLAKFGAGHGGLRTSRQSSVVSRQSNNDRQTADWRTTARSGTRVPN